MINCNLASSNFESVHLRDIVESSSLYIVPSDTTHYTATSDSWLDVFVVDDLDKVITLVNYGSLFIIGHDFLTLTLNFDVNLPLNCSKKMDTVGFLDHAFNCIVDVADMDVIELNLKLGDKIVGVLDVFAPLQQFTVRRFVRWLSKSFRHRLVTSHYTSLL